MITNKEKITLKVKVPKFIINWLDKSGFLGFEKPMTEKEMAQLAIYNYEHKTSQGEIRSSGKTYIDWLGNTHIIQKNEKGKKVYESIHLPDGRILVRR